MRFFLAVVRQPFRLSDDPFHTTNVWGTQLGRGGAISLNGRFRSMPRQDHQRLRGTGRGSQTASLPKNVIRDYR